MASDVGFVKDGGKAWDGFTSLDVWSNSSAIVVSVAGYLLLGVVVAFAPKIIKTIQYALAAYKYEHWRAEAVTFWGIAKLTPRRMRSMQRRGRYDLLVDMKQKTLRRLNYEKHGKIV